MGCALIMAEKAVARRGRWRRRSAHRRRRFESNPVPGHAPAPSLLFLSFPRSVQERYSERYSYTAR
jgi:hypothetical protein